MTIGEKIRTLRLVQGYKQEYMARQLGMSAGGYAKIERGESDISLGRLAQIAQVLRVELSALFTLELNTDQLMILVHRLHQNVVTPNTTNHQEIDKLKQLLHVILERLDGME